MKKILGILGTITLIGTSTTSLVSCNTPQEYTPEELKEIKEKNKIDTKNQTIRDNLEWIAPQEFWFNEIDNKWYYVVWRNYKSNDWRINKFNNNNISISIVMDNYPNLGKFRGRLQISNSVTDRILLENDDGTHFKSVYRWNGEEQKLPNLDIDKYGNIKIKGE
ncbi:lipoprotein [Spiroplasma endosymbiont of Megaselia nigra]|uniref:lipoprotein n=1 Tax=Spiroplasma endosymbiont of Megaselia nigra TaxID=2478537 RepID=UPI000F884BB7|nr:lipoprotein [Spiroplasma endosymbiont of Megaselia nigra]RUO86117.1 hypothetical protein D9R21_04960 [Spiroplasma endosymbiont of Megaselia nigra]